MLSSIPVRTLQRDATRRDAARRDEKTRGALTVTVTGGEGKRDGAERRAERSRAKRKGVEPNSRAPLQIKLTVRYGCPLCCVPLCAALLCSIEDEEVAE